MFTQFKILGGSFSYGANTVLKNIDFEIKEKQKIAVVGRNGCGKTTLLQIISGALELDRDDSGNSVFIKAGVGVIDTLRQTAFEDDNATLLEEVRKVYKRIIDMKYRLDDMEYLLETDHSEEKIKEYTALREEFERSGGYYFQKEYETVIKKFGFSEEDKYKSLGEFSGGQRTKIAFIKLLLARPDILLLDEPTNHLDINAIEWLEEFIKGYSGSVVIVSHDRMFLDRTVDTVYEIEHQTLKKYIGNYSSFVEQKKQNALLTQKMHDAQEKEIKKTEELIERFRYKATKAKMVQSKIKALEKTEIIDAPLKDDTKSFYADFEPERKSFRDVLITKNLKIGYTRVLSEITLTLLRGEKLGIIGGNGLGKSTFLKTVTSQIPSLGGEFNIGSNVDIGYFDQQSTQYGSEKTVLDDFWDEFPHLTETQARNTLGAFLFSGDDVFKTVNVLSGGEKVRLNLCKIFRKNPNFLILDEPTNHMDMIGKETLEDILLDFSGTVLFVSHDRYFVKKVATCLLVFEENGVKYYPYGYDEYLLSRTAPESAEIKAEKKEKKTYTTPAKEKAKRERKIAKLTGQIALSDEKLKQLNEELTKEEILSDYKKLDELQKEIEKEEESQLFLLEELEALQKEEL
ncbi:MAG: ABC-F family ATP-binding cassette domain-containing protein [Clostridiales bacterium]|nr:ABC-F family ATP-binding cassette domain-containing protein [Candidatus Equinaster intestinalis]